MILKGYLAISLTLFVAVSNVLFAINVNSYSSFNANSTEDSLYYDVFLKYRVQNIDSAIKYARLSYEQSQSFNDIDLGIKSLNALGYCYHKKYFYDSALYAYKKGVQQSKIVGNQIRQIFFYNDIGIIYRDIGIYDSALANYFSSLRLAEYLDRERDISIALMNIGDINMALENSETAINYILRSLSIKEENNYPGIDIAYNNLGICYNSLNEFEIAIDYFQKLLTYCESNECSLGTDEASHGLGLAYYGLGDFDLAKEFLFQILDTEDMRKKTRILGSLAEISKFKGNFDEAIHLADSSIILAKQVKSLEPLKDSYLIKSDILKEMGLADSALFYYQKHYLLKDSLFNETVALSIQDLFVGFEREQAEATIQVKEREIAIRKRTNILFALVIILSLAIIIKAIMDLTKRKKMNKYLDKQVALKTTELTESNENLLEKTKDLNDLIYNISHEIRGPLARLLGLINLGQIESHKELQEVKYYGKLQNEVIELESILKRMTITNYVNHHEVNIVGIEPDEFFEKLFANSRYLWQDKIKINLDLDGIGELTTDREMLEIALQNIIANAVKFRNPRNPDDPILNIKLEQGKKDRIDITMLDNGIGFDEKYKESITDLFFVASELGGVGIGLHQTKLALEKINAEFEVRSTRNPTTFVIHL